ncbi:hypothetical protein JOM56_015035 [Amanita muscaria]
MTLGNRGSLGGETVSSRLNDEVVEALGVGQYYEFLCGKGGGTLALDNGFVRPKERVDAAMQIDLVIWIWRDTDIGGLGLDWPNGSGGGLGSTEKSTGKAERSYKKRRKTLRLVQNGNGNGMTRRNITEACLGRRKRRRRGSKSDESAVSTLGGNSEVLDHPVLSAATREELEENRRLLKTSRRKWIFVISGGRA